MSDVLLLNGDASPLSIIPLSAITWQDAMCLVYKDRVNILDLYEDRTVNSPSKKFQMPAVIMLREYVKKSPIPKFCKDSLLYRDDFTCQYCNEEFSRKKLTMDHFKPKSEGGKKTFQNILMSCQPCNLKKGSGYLKPIKLPHTPTYFELASKRKNYPVYVAHESWAKYLDWNPDLIINVGKNLSTNKNQETTFRMSNRLTV